MGAHVADSAVAFAVNSAALMGGSSVGARALSLASASDNHACACAHSVATFCLSSMLMCAYSSALADAANVLYFSIADLS